MVPPSDTPMPSTSKATGSASIAPSDTFGATMLRMANTSTKVASTSDSRLPPVLRIAGPVQNTASLVSAQSVWSKWSR
ncbi:hypothetical protein D3C72_1983010 [compost metagenome]